MHLFWDMNNFCFALLYDAQKCEKRRGSRFYELPIEFTKSHWDWEICHKTATNLELNNEFCSIISFNCDTRKIMNYYLKAFIFLSGCIYLYFYFSIWIMWYAMCTFLSSKVLWFTNNYDYYIVPNKFWPPLKPVLDMKVLSGSAISQLSSRLLSPLQQVCWQFIFCCHR